MKTLATFALALALHLLLGWAWTILAAAAGGFWAVRRGWLVGLLGVGLDYLVLLIYTHAVATDATLLMTETLGGILRNLPGAGIVALSLLVGLLLGSVGGFVGTQAAYLFRPSPRPAPRLDHRDA